MKRRTVLSLTGLGLATLTTGCIGTEYAGTQSDEPAEQNPSSENTDEEQDAEDEGPIFSSDDGSGAEQQQQQQQEQNSEGESEDTAEPEPEAEAENNTEQHDEPDQQDGADESTDDESPPEIADLRVFVEHKELRETIPGATVIIRHLEEESAQWQKTTSTDPHRQVDGTFATFRAIPMGFYEVIVRADGFVESAGRVEVSKKELDVTVQLTPAESTVLFIVTDQYSEPHKSPVPGAEIDISYGMSETATVTTDEQGEARFTAPQSGEYTYSVRADGYQTPTEKRTVTVEDDTTVEITLRYPIHTLTVDAGEKNAEVELVRLRDKQTDEKTSGIDGKVYFEVYPGDYKVSAYLGSEVVTVPETTSVSLAD